MLDNVELNKDNIEYVKQLFEFIYKITISDEKVLNRFLKTLKEFLDEETKLKDLDKIINDPLINRKMKHPTKIKYILDVNRD